MGQKGTVWARTVKERERWRTLAVGCFLLWKDRVQNRTEYSKIEWTADVFETISVRSAVC